jgi:hypothetical protein
MSKKSSVRQRHQPQRTCVICRRKMDKRSLTRLVMVVEDEAGAAPTLIIDPSGKRNGRGAYLCDRVDCWEKAAKGTVLGALLRQPLSDNDRETIIKNIPINPETRV